MPIRRCLGVIASTRGTEARPSVQVIGIRRELCILQSGLALAGVLYISGRRLELMGKEWPESCNVSCNDCHVSFQAVKCQPFR